MSRASQSGVRWNRRQVIQASLASGLLAVFRPVLSLGQVVPPSDLTPAQAGVDASQQLASPDWKPAFLNDQQNETLISLSDLLIPDTDTPGAKQALVNRSIDTMLAAEPVKSQQKFLQDLAFLDAAGRQEYGKEFRALSADEHNELLRPLSYPERPSFWTEDAPPDPGREHFQRLKSRIVFAYYTSEIGMRELGWDGSITHGPFAGCPHPKGSHK